MRHRAVLWRTVPCFAGSGVKEPLQNDDVQRRYFGSCPFERYGRDLTSVGRALGTEVDSSCRRWLTLRDRATLTHVICRWLSPTRDAERRVLATEDADFLVVVVVELGPPASSSTDDGLVTTVRTVVAVTVEQSLDELEPHLPP